MMMEKFAMWAPVVVDREGHERQGLAGTVRSLQREVLDTETGARRAVVDVVFDDGPETHTVDVADMRGL